ncbi:hypothetical protein NE237_020909 [Protea cynaroides]|uniref:Uncharacterized protein n=1 Tax=Protea cynaroides TaxID=273540 RepID=A0A9Q0HC48_9MAGN|nr:hypothetical protein NE237_020909 [Protea cynaroides]
MFNPLACVNPRLLHQQRRDEEEQQQQQEVVDKVSLCSTSSSSTPRSLSATASLGKKGKSNKIWNRKKKNPYSTCGLDKFSSLLGDLEERRRKIFSLVASHSQDDVPDYVVQFIYSNSGDWVPIVVKLRDHSNQSRRSTHDEHKHNKHNKHDKAQESTTQKPLPTEAQAPAPDDHRHNYPPPSRCTTTPPPINNNKGTSTSTSSSRAYSPPKVVQLQQERPSAAYASSLSASNNKKKSQNRLQGYWRRPSQYLPLVLVLSLISLVIFGRSIAILLTSAWWYLVPTINTHNTAINPNPNKRLTDQKNIPSRTNDSSPTIHKWPKLLLNS